MHDKQEDILEPYIPKRFFKGFNGARISFSIAALRFGTNSHTVILSHINLLAIGYLIKIFAPQTRLILIAHGIEVWSPLPPLKNRMLRSVDVILPVSQYTRQQLMEVLNIPSNKLKVLNNCLDPFLQKAFAPQGRADLAQKYGINNGDLVLMTLTRLKHSEQYKGYDKVISAISAVKKYHPAVKYLIAGKYDAAEKLRVDSLIAHEQVASHVVFTGYVSDADLPALFSLADVYIMPSLGEGFGIVFIEALFYGKPVIAGNKDGSVDALDNGRFGLLINPDSKEEIIDAILKIAANKEAFVPDQKRLFAKFGFEQYQEQWRDILYTEREAGPGKNKTYQQLLTVV